MEDLSLQTYVHLLGMKRRIHPFYQDYLRFHPDLLFFHYFTDTKIGLRMDICCMLNEVIATFLEVGHCVQLVWNFLPFHKFIQLSGEWYRPSGPLVVDYVLLLLSSQLFGTPMWLVSKNFERFLIVVGVTWVSSFCLSQDRYPIVVDVKWVQLFSI